MVCVLDLVELDELAIELVAGVDAADRPLSGASANEHADPTPWLRGGELLMMDGLELRRSKRHIDAYVERIVKAGVAALTWSWASELAISPMVTSFDVNCSFSACRRFNSSARLRAPISRTESIHPVCWFCASISGAS